MRSPPWNDEENTAGIALYFTMLDRATAVRPYNKAAMIREAQGQPRSGQVIGNHHVSRYSDAPLANRSRGSIEAKLMNMSAAHRDIAGDVETMDAHGYRCLSNYQSSLKVAMQLAITRRETTERPYYQSGAACPECGDVKRLCDTRQYHREDVA